LGPRPLSSGIQVGAQRFAGWRRPAGSAQRRACRAAQWRPARLLGATAVPDGGADRSWRPPGRAVAGL